MRCLLLLLAVLHLTAVTVGPESTVVVVNGDDAAGTAVAEAFCRLRRIPADQVVTLRGLPTGVRIGMDDFRTRILGAVEEELVRRGIAERMALVAYAPGLPTAVAFDAGKDAAPTRKGPGSLTSLTLLAPLLAAGPDAFTAYDANPYAEHPLRPGAEQDAAAAADPADARIMKLMAAKQWADARTALTALAQAHPAPTVLYNLACVEALLGQADAAEVALERAIAAGWMDDLHTATDPDLTTLRGRPAWKGLLERTAANATQVHPDTSPRFTPLPARDGSPPGRLAMLLAPSGPRGLTADEAIALLERSVAADGSRPAGTVWFMASADQARTGPRRWAFAAAAAALREAGVTAEIREGVLPPAGAQVIGAAIGIAGFDWGADGATILPGAWCDHLTSLGGVMQVGAKQTSLSAFLRAGAAGAGGAVAEPMNLHLKFPSAFLHLHRVRGLTLAEAVYRSMACPYQYLAAGDPLSQPWPAAPTPAQPPAP
jgi:hypothetical protein